jgi:hypothetical protein
MCGALAAPHARAPHLGVMKSALLETVAVPLFCTTAPYNLPRRAFFSPLAFPPPYHLTTPFINHPIVMIPALTSRVIFSRIKGSAR